MSDELDPTELDDNLRALFRELPRESALEPRELDHVVTALRADGFLQTRRRRSTWMMQLAAGIVLATLGGVVGARLATRNSLESRLERADLSIPDRILLMQRAGSAYVRAANSYASAAARTDSTAIEVASRVLLGAAQAVARNNLDGGLTPNLTTALRTITSQPVSPSRQRVIWF
jgi:hypothetical protein